MVAQRKGLALTIGVNAVAPEHYNGWSGKLRACEADATALAAVAVKQGFQVTTLLTAQATRDNVLSELARAAQSLKANDLFLLTYAGHGGQIPDSNRDEEDLADETWCLYDGQLIDDELEASWAAFAPHVRVLVLSDSCHSGTVFRDAADAFPLLETQVDEATPSYRLMPRDIAVDTYLSHRAFYDGLLERLAAQPRKRITASVRLMSACLDDQLAADGFFHGLFTGMLLDVWNGGQFDSGYRAMHTAIRARMPSNQTPNYLALGKPDPAFDELIPFTL